MLASQGSTELPVALAAYASSVTQKLPLTQSLSVQRPSQASLELWNQRRQQGSDEHLCPAVKKAGLPT